MLRSLRQSENELTLNPDFKRKNERKNERSPVLRNPSNEQQTMAPPPREDIEFRTLSKVTLRGWLYPAEKRGPGIILSAGVRDHLMSKPESNVLS
jgi:hypothetical protein